MNEFIARYEEQLNGVLSGFDRLVFRGTLGLNHEAGLKGYLWANHLGLKDFGAHAERVSREVKEASLAAMEGAGRPFRYLNSGKEDKQALAQQIAARDQIRNGPICSFSAVELCSSYAVRGDRATQKLRLERAFRKCLFIYQYWMHPVLGFMSARLQTWFPFPIHIYLNGRLWLARQMEQAGMGYRRHHNCFTWIEDFARAQQLMDAQLSAPWTELLDGVAGQIHPYFEQLCHNYPMHYYWTCQDSEWAMDIVFRDRRRLERLYPQLVHLGMTSFSSPDVLRFMGKRVTRQGTAVGGHEVPVSSDLKVRPNGVRIKHRLGANSIKLYDKAYDELGAVLRPEITITDTLLFRVFRPKNGEPDSPPQWRAMRRWLADLQRRAEVSQKALDCYCDALAGWMTGHLTAAHGAHREARALAGPVPTGVASVRSGRPRPASRHQPRRVRHSWAAQPRPSATALRRRPQMTPLGGRQPKAQIAARARADPQTGAHAPLSGQSAGAPHSQRHPLRSTYDHAAAYGGSMRKSSRAEKNLRCCNTKQPSRNQISPACDPLPQKV